MGELKKLKELKIFIAKWIINKIKNYNHNKNALEFLAFGGAVFEGSSLCSSKSKIKSLEKSLAKIIDCICGICL